MVMRDSSPTPCSLRSAQLCSNAVERASPPQLVATVRTAERWQRGSRHESRRDRGPRHRGGPGAAGPGRLLGRAAAPGGRGRRAARPGRLLRAGPAPPRAAGGRRDPARAGRLAAHPGRPPAPAAGAGGGAGRLGAARRRPARPAGGRRRRAGAAAGRAGGRAGGLPPARARGPRRPADRGDRDLPGGGADRLGRGGLAVGSLAWEGDGIWRASGTLSYPNAAAAVLVPVALVGLARLAGAPRSFPLVVAVTGLLAGAAATMSRAGALVALAGLVPSMLGAGQPRPLLAVVGLAAGLALAVGVAAAGPGAGAKSRTGVRREMALVAGVVLLLGGLAAVAVLGGGEAYRRVVESRATLASPDRADALRAAAQVVADYPLGGAGPGHTQLRWEGPDGGARYFTYAHNEYVQVAADLGLVGVALLAVLLVALARLLWRARATAAGPWVGAVAAACAFAVHSGFDFVWHLPAVVLTVMLLVGVVLPAPRGADARIPSHTRPRKGI